MTTVERLRLKSEVRWGQVYGIDVIDHDSWMAGSPRIVLNDYVGQSRQKRRARENQHRDSQGFSDLIVGSPRVLWEGFCTDAELDEMERRFIQDVPFEQRPRLNYLLNEDNPHRVEKWRQKEQRHQRDAVRGDEPWEPTAYRPEQYGYRPAPQPRTQAARKPWSSRRKHLTGLLVAWLVLTVTGWSTVAYQADLTDRSWLAIPYVALVLTVWVWAGVPIRKPGRRKAVQRIRRRLQIKGRRR
jgi:hypothetical protein